MLSARLLHEWVFEWRLEFGLLVIIIRTAFYGKKIFLDLALDQQEHCLGIERHRKMIFVDYHENTDENLFMFAGHETVFFNSHVGRRIWIEAINSLLREDEYFLIVEDDVILSYDFILICEEVISRRFLERPGVFYMHPGAWEKPSGDPNKIINSRTSSRAILIHRSKFVNFVLPYLGRLSTKGSDSFLCNISMMNLMVPVAPEMNRHSHIGIFGMSTNSREQIPQSDEKIELAIMNGWQSGDVLRRLNQNKNPGCFWDFSPDIKFESLYFDVKIIDGTANKRPVFWGGSSG